MQATARGTIEELADRLGAATARLQVLLRRELIRAEITLSQARTLGTLKRQGPKRLTDLALIEQVSQPTMSALVARMEAQGLVTRGTDGNDRRTAYIAITPDGEQLLRSIVRVRTRLLSAHLSRMKDTDRAALSASLPALERLVTELQGREGERVAAR
ncbi:MAG TPA: MarR family transcriptional regulator [Candidatus Limnocylindrales bacterium]|nr:MarR family transcriptional regulator [Candidatus Limnocylindrales bacterium]